MEEWADVYPKILFMIGNQNRSDSKIYTDILIEEREKEKLLAFVKKSPSSVENDYTHLIPEHKEVVYDLFIQ